MLERKAVPEATPPAMGRSGARATGSVEWHDRAIEAVQVDAGRPHDPPEQLLADADRRGQSELRATDRHVRIGPAVAGDQPRDAAHEDPVEPGIGVLDT